MRGAGMWQCGELEAHVLREKCNVIGMLEAWLKQDIDWEIKLQGCLIQTRDEGSKAGIAGNMGKRNITSEKIKENCWFHWHPRTHSD